MTPLYVIDFICVPHFGEAQAPEDVLKELLEALAKILVEYPEEVQVHLVKGQWKLSRPQISDANE